MSMSDDLWSADQGPDPLDDEVVTEETTAEAPAVEETPAAVPVEEAADAPAADGEQGSEGAEGAEESEETPPQPPSPDEDWKRRYSELRNSRENSAAELKRTQAEYQALQDQVRQYLTLEQQRAQAPEPPAPQAPREPTDAELASYGLDRDQYRLLIDHFRAQAESQVAPKVQELTAQQQEMARRLAEQQQQAQSQLQIQQQEAERARMAQTISAFGEKHPEFVGDTLEAQGLRDDFDSLVTRWNNRWGQIDGAEFDPADGPSLEVAAEAMRWPALADVLADQPHLFESPRGLELARAQARILDAGAPQKSSKKVDAKATDAALEAAYTEPGTSGPTQSANAQKDEFDAALDEWRSDQTRSIFS